MRYAIYKAITAVIVLPLLFVVSCVALPIILIAKTLVKLFFSGFQTNLKNFFCAAIGYATIDYFNKNKNKNKKINLLAVPFIFVKDNLYRILSTIIGSRIIAAIYDEFTVFDFEGLMEPEFKKNIASYKKALAILKSILHLLTWPIEIPRRIIGMFIYHIIVVSQWFPPSYSEYLAKELQDGDYHYQCKEFFVQAVDGSYLSTFELIHNDNKGKKQAEILYIIRAGGNGDLPSISAGFLGCALELANKLKQNGNIYNVIGFNYNSAGKSTGLLASESDLIHNGIAQAKALLKRGVPAEHILLDGFSLGAGVAAKVAAYFKEKYGLELKHTINDRSFDKIGAVTPLSIFLPWLRMNFSRLKPIYNYLDTLEGKIDKINNVDFNSPENVASAYTAKKAIENSFLGVVVRKVLKWCRLDIYAGKALAKIDDNKKTVVRVANDGVIHPLGSMEFRCRYAARNDSQQPPYLIGSLQGEHCGARSDLNVLADIQQRINSTTHTHKH